MTEIFNAIVAKLQLISVAKNTGADYMLALLLFLVVYGVLKIIRISLAKIATKKETNVGKIFAAYAKEGNVLPYIIIALYAGIRSLIMPVWLSKTVYAFFLVTVIYLAIMFLSGPLRAMIRIRVSRPSKKERITQYQDAMIGSIFYLVRLILWSAGIILIFSNLDINITSTIASLGFVGVVIALAAQHSMSDVFGGFMIFADRPFDIGDFIETGTDKGWVQLITLKSTRLKAETGEEITIPNKEFTNSRIRNFSRLKQHTHVMVLYVAGSNTHKQLVCCCKLITESINTIEGVTCTRCFLERINEHNYQYNICFTAKTDSYDVFTKLRSDVNLKIVQTLEAHKICLSLNKDKKEEEK